MNLSELDLQGYGHFEKDSPATFTLDRLDQPLPWDYIYQNRKLLLKVDQRGPVYSQVDPPSDIVLFRRESFQACSSWMVWLRSNQFACKAFTNYFHPTLGGGNPSDRPDRVCVTFAPTVATYQIEHEGLRCVTEVSVPRDKHAVVLRIRLTNLHRRTLKLSAFPVMRPYVNPAMLAPWDKPEWYLKTACVKADALGFVTRLYSVESDLQSRRNVVLWSSPQHATSVEISHEKFVGQGTFEHPEALFGRRLRMPLEACRPWGVFAPENSLFGFPPVYALQYEISLPPGKTRGIDQVLHLLPAKTDGGPPTVAEGRRASVWLDGRRCASDQAAQKKGFKRYIGLRSMQTGNAALDQYVNEWLPLQLDWACSLDRGWPTGMRGSRDSANDFTAMVPLNSDWSRSVLETVMACQRSDGWFPRQYSALGRLGKHDMRGHVDGGNWVIELLYTYLCYTKDWSLLRQPLPWLDRDAKDSILEHALRALDYYLDDENIGEHGLCKIREGDWLDSVNRAGMRGRGESVTVTNQTVIALVQMSEILQRLTAMGRLRRDRYHALPAQYAARRDSFLNALRRHAYNRAGYFNSVFNDDGHWVFSDRDPDGERRVYGPANWYSIASGAAGDRTDSVLRVLDVLRSPHGYRVIWPPMGRKPISSVGRGGSGDQPEGLFENGNVYNQGSHGFLGRALATAGKGDLLHDVLLYLLPFDQARHKVAETMTPPYAVVNCYHQAPPFMYRGGFTFLTGSIACGLRMAYEWMLGIQPMLTGLCIDPCVASHQKKLRAQFRYRGTKVQLDIHNPEGVQAGVKSMTLNDRPVTATRVSPFSGRTAFVAADARLEPRNRIAVTL